MPLFEVAILQKPTKKESEEGTGTEKLIFGPKFAVARDGQTAAITAIMESSGAGGVLDMARAEVLVRPFA